MFCPELKLIAVNCLTLSQKMFLASYENYFACRQHLHRECFSNCMNPSRKWFINSKYNLQLLLLLQIITKVQPLFSHLVSQYLAIEYENKKIWGKGQRKRKFTNLEVSSLQNEFHDLCIVKMLVNIAAIRVYVILHDLSQNMGVTDFVNAAFINFMTLYLAIFMQLI